VGRLGLNLIAASITIVPALKPMRCCRLSYHLGIGSAWQAQLGGMVAVSVDDTGTHEALLSHYRQVLVQLGFATRHTVRGSRTKPIGALRSGSRAPRPILPARTSDRHSLARQGPMTAASLNYGHGNQPQR
jgi:hypothetical protein